MSSLVFQERKLQEKRDKKVREANKAFEDVPKFEPKSAARTEEMS
eukprot:CAMPEP_0170499084 /NCGR_PEP_ID=MMETSP0208-20121228/30029_1 /TAXON_ID=197538 /ORGANISM="Strombidium inclinatum, Strain S3" /LENGTH=44 /DNA_ID= /DNA_START= /DNA_END= /DNA_ORIENTATION=